MNNNQLINILSLGIGIWALYIAYDNLFENREQSKDSQEILDSLEIHLKNQDSLIISLKEHLKEQDKVLEYQNKLLEKGENNVT